MRIAILGPTDVRAGDGSAVDVRGGRLRALLVRLALDAGRPVGTATLVDALWGEDPPAAVANALQSLVSRLRTALGSADAVRSGPAGYTLSNAEVDAAEFERLVTAARSANPRTALDLLTSACELWRGDALADVRDAPFADAPAARLDNLRFAAAEDRTAALIALGRAGEAVAVLAPLAAAHPLRERTHELLIRALHTSGRQTDALTTYDALRTRLADELGVDPSTRLREIHTAVLRGEPLDPSVRRAVPAGPEGESPVPPNNLRARLTSFVGRDDDVAAVGKLLAGSRLVTLVGPGGAGKTRLATETALKLGAQSPDGIWFVELAPLGDPADVAPAIMSALGASEVVSGARGNRFPTVRAAKDRLLEVLSDRRITLVLDNCEHLVGEVADLTETLVGGCPRLRVLATSREPLGIPGEQLYPVGPLSLPPPDEGAVTPYAAVQLFVDRALAVRPAFTLTASNAWAVGEICRRLDGLPLAIELAAARLRSLSPDQIVDRLTDRFRLLTTGSRTALPRHQTLRAVVEWSWDLLGEAELAVARRLSVFAGGATLEAAERVCAGDPVGDVLAALASLVDKSLVEASGTDGVRYWMLETVKAFGAERLAETGETDAVRRLHAEYFRDLVAEASPRLRTGEQLVWIARFDADHDNLLAALRYAVDSRDADLAIRLVSVLGEYWSLRGRPAEAQAWFEAALALRGPSPPEQRAMTLFLFAIGIMAAEGSERTETVMRKSLRAVAEIRLLARRHPTADLRLFGAVADAIGAMLRRDRAAALTALDYNVDDPDPWKRSMGRMMRAMMAENEGEMSQMRADLDAALEGFQSLGDRWGMSLSLRGIASHAMQSGDHVAARDALTEALRLVSELGTHDGVPMLFCQRAQSRAELGDVDGARADLLHAREMATQDGSMDGDMLAAALLGALERRAGNLAAARELTEPVLERMTLQPERVPPQGMSMITALLARITVAEGDLDEARRLARRAFGPAALAQDMPVLSAVVEVLADVQSYDDPATAARTLGIAAQLRGIRSVPDQDVRRTVTALRYTLGDAAYEEAYEAGATLTRQEALTELGVPIDPPPFADLVAGGWPDTTE